MLSEIVGNVLGGPTNQPLPLGAPVQKIKGYKWPGIIVSAFHTTSGQLRYVVECTVPEVEGALHIYAPEQIELKLNNES
ncbi:hypothetical protein IWQ49_006047 [Labrenzia sp. EL_126]|nr:hypothetical protein [Labrenzia sp. EL_126]